MPQHKHRVFLGSSKEALWLAKQIEGPLSLSDVIEIHAWYHYGNWPLGASTLETLENRLSETDFAIMVLSEDDLVQSRDAPPRPAARDNVIFELGLFMGRLGRDRAFFFYPIGLTERFKIPSDLFGITGLRYANLNKSNPQSNRSILSPLCTQVEQQIQEVIAREHSVAMQARPKVDLIVNFPEENGHTDPDSNHLSAANVSVLKLRASIDDDNVDDLYIYFDQDLNLYKAPWQYAIADDGRRYYWAANPQLQAMKEGSGFISFEIRRPKKGRHVVEIAAIKDRVLIYTKKFTIPVY